MTARSRTLPTIPTIAAFVLGAVALAALAGIAMRPRPLTGTTPIHLSDLGRRVLVIATHPDDEVLTAGGAVNELIAEGAQVKVVIATAGDAYFRAAQRIATGAPGASDYRELGNTRHRESLAAAVRLGLPATDVISLGYSDGGTDSMWSGSWDPAHPYAGRSDSAEVPYPWAYRPAAVQCGQDIAADLTQIVKTFSPDTVIAPDPRETNLDHAAIGAFTMYSLDVADFTGHRLTAVVHFKHFPYPWAYLPSAGMAPPPHLMEPGAEWLALPITTASEAAKKAAFEEYRSQTAIVDLAWYMRAFVRTNELFCRRAPSIPAVAATDDRPGAGDLGTIAVTPVPVIPATALNPARVSALRMVRGPSAVWFGVVCDGRIDPRTEYRVGVRLVGGGTAPRRLDLLVRDGSVQALPIADDSLLPIGLSTVADGDTLWISVPASVLEGRTRAVVGSSSAIGTRTWRTPWVDVQL